MSIPRRMAPSHPSLVQHAEDRAQYVQNRIADTITRFANQILELTQAIHAVTAARQPRS